MPLRRQKRAAGRAAARIALAIAPILALSACDQVASIWNRMRGGEAAHDAGPAQLEQVPLEARALSGAVQPQDEVAALLAPEPVLVAPGEILIGAKVEQRLDDSAQQMGLGASLVQSLRTRGVDALDDVPEQAVAEVVQRAEAAATANAQSAVRDVLGRLGVQGQVNVSPGGVITVDLAQASKAFHGGAQAGETAIAQAQALPAAVEWNEADRCPRIVTQGALEQDVALATRCAIQRLLASGQFEFVEPNYIATDDFIPPPRRPPPPRPSGSTTTATTPTPPPPAPVGGTPNDPLFALQWDMRARGSGAHQSPGGAGFESFWLAHQVGSRGVRVAVLDTGIDLTHPEIHNSPNVATGVDLITNSERAGDGGGVDGDAQDAGDRCGAASEDSFHGTHVAGTIGAAATNDRVGVAGGAWNVTIVPVRVLGHCGGELGDIVSGIRWAAGLAPAIADGGAQITNAAPVDIINMSLSIQTPCPASMQAAIDAAVARNVVIVVAAGNKADQAAKYAPANCNNVLVVAANDERGDLAFYSNFGAPVDLIAPGGDTFADSDNDGKPDGILSTRATQAGCYDPINQSSTARCYYSFLQGTSMAAPHVSAALALLAAQTGLRGRPLENALMTRALAPFGSGFGQIECARSRNATPISTGSETCARPAGLGVLDLSRAVATIAPRAPGASP